MKNGNGGDLSDVEIEPEEIDDDSVHVLQQVSRAFSIIKVTREIGLKITLEPWRYVQINQITIIQRFVSSTVNMDVLLSHSL